jgi:hypothetical protein
MLDPGLFPIFGQVGHPLLFVLLAAAVFGAYVIWYMLRTFRR